LVNIFVEYHVGFFANIHIECFRPYTFRSLRVYSYVHYCNFGLNCKKGLFLAKASGRPLASLLSRFGQGGVLVAITGSIALPRAQE
jgi:hypothetical protein